MTVVVPNPTSVASRALRHLESLPLGAEIANAALCEAIGADPSGMHSSMLAHVRRGAVIRRQKGGHPRSPVFWSLPGDVSQVADDDDGKPTQRTIAAAEAPPLNIVKPIWPVFREPGKEAPQEGANRDASAEQSHGAEGSASPPMGAGQPAAAAPLATGFGPKIEKRPVDQALPLRAALWSDGQLELRRGTTFVALLDPDETRELVDYLVGTRAGE